MGLITGINFFDTLPGLKPTLAVELTSSRARETLCAAGALTSFYMI